MKELSPLFQLIIGILSFSLFIRIYKILSQLFKHIIRANKRVKYIIFLLRAKEFPSSIFSIFIDIIYYIIISIKVVIIIVEFFFYEITLLLKGRVYPIV